MACPDQTPLQRDPQVLAGHYDRISRRIGMKLREMYGTPEADPLPNDHVDLLLRLRHKEREQTRMRGA